MGKEEELVGQLRKRQDHVVGIRLEEFTSLTAQ
jgi:hypothetical protein